MTYRVNLKKATESYILGIAFVEAENAIEATEKGWEKIKRENHVKDYWKEEGIFEIRKMK